jgi:orotate phosphoribosyltransferase
MKGDGLRSALESSEALKQGHFLLSSGLHSPAYVQCALLLSAPERARAVGEALAKALGALGVEIDSVLSPALGGVIIGHEVAAALDVPFRFVEREGTGLALRRGFALRPGERFAVVEDVVTTGKSTLEAAGVGEAAGGRLSAIGAILDRSSGRHRFDAPFASLLALDFPTWRPEECPLCAAGGQAVKPGSRPQPPK